MSALCKIIKTRNYYSSRGNSLFFLHISTSTLSPPHHHTPTRHDPNTSYYDELVNAAGRTCDFPRLRRILIERINYKSFNSKDTFKFVTKTQSSLNILDDLIDCLSSLPRGATRASAYNSLIKRLCYLGLVDSAVKVLDKMRHRSLEVNSYSYEPVIQALIKSDEIEKALMVLERMKELQIDPEMALYNYFLTWYCMQGDVPHAVDVLEKIGRIEGAKGDSTTYDAMVIGACKMGMVEGAVMVIRAALDDGVAVMSCTYGRVIKALIEAGYYEQAIQFVMSFAGRNKKLDNENFDSLGFGLIEVEKFEEAKMVVDEMSKRGLSMRKKVKEFYQLHASD